MTIGPPAPAGLALAPCERPVVVNPPGGFRFGNINTTVIGPSYAEPKVRLPGAGGAPEIAASCREVIVVLRQSQRSFVDRVDFVTSVGFGDGPGYRERLGLTGAGPRRVISDLGILSPTRRPASSP